MGAGKNSILYYLGLFFLVRRKTRNYLFTLTYSYSCSLDADSSPDSNVSHSFVCYPGLTWNRATCTCDPTEPCDERSHKDKKTHRGMALSLKSVVYLLIGELLVVASFFVLYINRKRCWPTGTKRTVDQCQAGKPCLDVETAGGLDEKQLAIS